MTRSKKFTLKWKSARCLACQCTASNTVALAVTRSRIRTCALRCVARPLSFSCSPTHQPTHLLTRHVLTRHLPTRTFTHPPATHLLTRHLPTRTFTHSPATHLLIIPLIHRLTNRLAYRITHPSTDRLTDVSTHPSTAHAHATGAW
jgi:hypothetical protein